MYSPGATWSELYVNETRHETCGVGRGGGATNYFDGK